MLAMKTVAFLDVTPCTNESHLRVIKVEVLQQFGKITTDISSVSRLQEIPWAGAYTTTSDSCMYLSKSTAFGGCD
jgi:hypothetical protein